jgi:hypothetical protein
MESLSSDLREVNGVRLKEVTDFLQNKSESGEIPSGTASNAGTAIRQLGGMLRADEPDDAAFALEHIEELARRYGNKHPKSNRDTTKAYVSRMTFALDCFIGWKKDPLNYKFPQLKERPKRDPKAERPESKSKAEPATAANEPSGSAYRRVAVYRGPGKRDAFLTLPEDESAPWSRDDCYKLLWIALGHAHDFDPQSMSVSMVRRQGES